ncbi:TPA: hypothetical protein U2L35_002445 [Burkholderia cenocepacia]|nr:hypothetical protein [Burkholderia cenocepacia]
MDCRTASNGASAPLRCIFGVAIAQQPNAVTVKLGAKPRICAVRSTRVHSVSLENSKPIIVTLEMREDAAPAARVISARLSERWTVESDERQTCSATSIPFLMALSRFLSDLCRCVVI